MFRGSACSPYSWLLGTSRRLVSVGGSPTEAGESPALPFQMNFVTPGIATTEVGGFASQSCPSGERSSFEFMICYQVIACPV